jgi:hypothetical protein
MENRGENPMAEVPHHEGRSNPAEVHSPHDVKAAPSAAPTTT